MLAGTTYLGSVPLATTDFVNLLNQAPLTPGQLSTLQYRSIDTMKWNKDTIANQPTDTTIHNIIKGIADNFNVTHIAVAAPMDEQADYVAAGVNLPSPRTPAAFWQKWCDEIHARGINVLFRGTFNGLEGLYNFTKQVGSQRYYAGIASEVIPITFTDSFNRANGSVGANYTTSGAWSIAGNLVTCASGASWGSNEMVSVANYRDFTATARLQVPAGGNIQFVFRSSLTAGYGAQIRSGEFRLERWGLAQLGTAAKTFVPGQWYKIKVSCVGSLIQCKVWPDGGSEPVAWDITAMDSTYTTGGIGFGVENTTTNTPNFDDLSITVVPFTQSWLGRVYSWIINHPTFFRPGDIFAPLPERTQGIFSDSTAFLPATGPGIQANYAQFFNDLVDVETAAFAQIGVAVKPGFTANNYSEVASGWIPQGLYDKVQVTATDEYGSAHDTTELYTQINGIYNQHGYKVFHQEWGDYWNDEATATTPDADALFRSNEIAYLRSIYDAEVKLLQEGKLLGFNYWGFWINSQEGIAVQNSDGTFVPNFRGQVLAQYLGTIPPATAFPPADTGTPPSNPGTIPPTVTPPAPTPTPVIPVNLKGNAPLVSRVVTTSRYSTSTWDDPIDLWDTASDTWDGTTAVQTHSGTSVRLDIRR